MVSVPVTAPLRSAEDIEKCLDEFANRETEAVVTVSEAHRSPFFNMVKRDQDGTVSLVIPSSSTVARRQDAPAVFDMTTVAYVVSPQFVLAHNSLFEGRVRAVTIPLERAIDIDTLLDFQIAEFLMQQRA
jgi:N-acylneuraminate cytidylyltransferase